MFKTFKEMKKYIQPYKMLYIIGTLFTILFALLAQVDPYVTGIIIDGIIENQGTSFVISGTLIIIIVTLFRSYIRYKFFMLFEEFSQKVVYALRRDLYKKLQGLDFTYFDNTPNGQVMSKMTGDIEAIRHFFAWITHVSIFHGFVFIFALVAMFFINPLLTVSLTIIVPFILVLSLKLSERVKPSFTKIREQFSKLNTVVSENISGNRVVKAFARETYEIQKFELENKEFMERNLESAKIWEKYLPALDGFAVLFNVIVLLFGSVLILNNKMTIGELVAFNRLLWMINNPLRMLGWMINGTQNFTASFDKVKELLNAVSSIKESDTPILDEDIKGYIRFENVDFQFENLPILKDISFQVEPGQSVALLGATGSGKSTLTSLLSRFYDVNSGTIYIDNHPIEDYSIQSLRKNIAVAMQDIFLFSETIENNIIYGMPNASKKDVRHAAEIAGVNEFIHQFEDDFETVVGERGVGLSGGQKQRIALARALIQNPSILILDDTTSAVDMETEYRILAELKKVNKNRTTFIIAHRISSVKDADLILVMEDGQIIERGTHDELIDAKGYYYDIFTQQMGEFNHPLKEGA